jgi:hypothetical protein
MIAFPTSHTLRRGLEDAGRFLLFWGSLALIIAAAAALCVSRVLDDLAVTVATALNL